MQGRCGLSCSHSEEGLSTVNIPSGYKKATDHAHPGGEGATEAQTLRGRLRSAGHPCDPRALPGSEEEGPGPSSVIKHQF